MYVLLARGMRMEDLLVSRCSAASLRTLCVCFTYIIGSISLWVLLLYGFPNIVGYDVIPLDGLVLAAIR